MKFWLVNIEGIFGEVYGDFEVKNE